MVKFVLPSGEIVPIKLLDLYPVTELIKCALAREGISLMIVCE